MDDRIRPARLLLLCAAAAAGLFEREQADRLLFLGDLLYHGPRNDLPRDYAPKKVIPLLNSLAPRPAVCARQLRRRGGPDGAQFPGTGRLRRAACGQRLVYVTHGHVFNLNHLPPLAPGDILLHGHTHVPAWTNSGQGSLYLNPGSVSLPKENTAHSYMTLREAPPVGRPWRARATTSCSCDNVVIFQVFAGKSWKKLLTNRPKCCKLSTTFKNRGSCKFVPNAGGAKCSSKPHKAS